MGPLLREVELGARQGTLCHAVSTSQFRAPRGGQTDACGLCDIDLSSGLWGCNINLSIIRGVGL